MFVCIFEEAVCLQNHHQGMVGNMVYVHVVIMDVLHVFVLFYLFLVKYGRGCVCVCVIDDILTFFSIFGLTKKRLQRYIRMC